MTLLHDESVSPTPLRCYLVILQRFDRAYLSSFIMASDAQHKYKTSTKSAFTGAILVATGEIESSQGVAFGRRLAAEVLANITVMFLANEASKPVFGERLAAIWENLTLYTIWRERGYLEARRIHTRTCNQDCWQLQRVPRM
jgi:hypothetical protein